MVPTASASPYANTAQVAFDTDTDQPLVSDQLVKKADPFVSTDEGRFVLDEGAARAVLSEAELQQVRESIDSTNEQIALGEQETGLLATNNGNTVTVYASRKDRAIAQDRSSSGDVTKIEYHWFYARIYISKEPLLAASAGTAVGGVWVPEPIISKVLATLGIVGAWATEAYVDKGIVFDVNYADLALIAVSPASFPFRNAHLQ